MAGMPAPYIAGAAQRHADLIGLGETVPTATLNTDMVAHAKPIAGPSTRYFCGLAERHRLHMVLSLCERTAHLVYNTPVLIGPDGRLVGKYRKVSLPHSEKAKGIASGNESPVFATAF